MNRSAARNTGQIAKAFARILIPLLILFTAPLFGQEGVRLTLDLGSDVEIVHRWSYTIRRDGRYQGQTYRESHLLLSRTDTDGAPYTGEFMVSEDTVRMGRTIAQRLAERRDAQVTFFPTGAVRAPEGQRAPLFRDIPYFSDKILVPGESWQAPGVAQFYVENDLPVAVAVLVEYTYVGDEVYQGQTVHRVTGLYAVRAPLSRGQFGSHPARELISGLPLLPADYTLHGRHELTILLPVDGGPPIFQRTEIEEQLQLPSGSLEGRKGFILTWYHSTDDFTSTTEADRIAQQIRESGVRDIEVQATPDNRVSLSIQNLHFVADQAVLLPGEEQRLDQIADIVKSIPDRTILVVGHTADVGTSSSQLTLSYDRAKKIVEELTNRGVDAGRLFYDGRGGTEPVATNDTDEGRAANRRVEIEILPVKR